MGQVLAVLRGAFVLRGAVEVDRRRAIDPCGCLLGTARAAPVGGSGKGKPQGKLHAGACLVEAWPCQGPDRGASRGGGGGAPAPQQEAVTPSGNALPNPVHRRLTTGAGAGRLRPGGRCVIVGDVHGCIDELRALLAEVAFDSQRDNLCVVGDHVTKGPESRQVLRALQALGAHCVRGNNDDKAVAAYAAWQRGEEPLDKFAFVAGLDADDVAWLAALPFSISMPEYGVVAVHAGLVPGVPLERQQLWAVCTMRVLFQEPDGTWLPFEGEKTLTPVGARPCAECWPGPVHVVFGHDSKRGLQRAPFATGLDTACATGGRLSAVVLPPLDALRKSAAFRRKLRSGAPLTLADLRGEVVSVPSQQPCPPS